MKITMAVLSALYQPKFSSKCIPTYTHVDIVKPVFNPLIYRTNRLIESLIKSNNLVEARQVFDEMPAKNEFSWNLIITAYVKNRRVEEARLLFDRWAPRDVISWSVMIGGYAQVGNSTESLKLFSQMQRLGIQPDRVTFTGILGACNHLSTSQQAKHIHCLIVKTGYASDLFVENTLVDSYSKCQDLQNARKVFDKMRIRDGISFNAMISGYARNGCPEEALGLYLGAVKEGFIPTQFTFSGVLSACADISNLNNGKAIHAHIVRSGYEWHVIVNNALMNMYCKLGRIDDGHKVFDKMPLQDEISWNVLITGYVWHAQAEEALDLFHQLQQIGFDASQFAFPSIFSACASLQALRQGMQLHAQIIKIGIESNCVVGNALIDMYAKCGHVEDAYKMFDKMPNKIPISWTAIIAGYSHVGSGEEALKLFSQMQRKNIKADEATYASVLRACASLGALEQGKQIHVYMIRNGYESNIFAGSALLNMYAKCGSIHDAEQVFNVIPHRNLVLWNAMICAFAQNGYGIEALQLFDEMLEGGIGPDYVSLVCVLAACSHRGLVDKACHYFESMRRDFGIRPRVEHYSCMIDLLARAGKLEDAANLINNMPFKADVQMWMSLLSACRTYGNVKLGQEAAERLFELEPQDSAPYVVMSNIYSAVGMWDDAAKLKKLMKDRGVKKEPAYSWIVLNSKSYEFAVYDRSHSQTEEIYATLESRC